MFLIVPLRVWPEGSIWISGDLMWPPGGFLGCVETYRFQYYSCNSTEYFPLKSLFSCVFGAVQ